MVIDVGDDSNNFSLHVADARTPAMDVQMAAQDACMTRSFHVFLSAMLIEDDG